MRITRQADYAVRAVLYLARLGPGQRVSTAQIAESQHIPMSFLSKIVSQLAAAGLVRSMRGVRGGVALARAPDKITLRDIVEAIDGPMLMNDCTATPAACAMSGGCTVRPVWCDLRHEIAARLERVTFAQLVAPGAPDLITL